MKTYLSAIGWVAEKPVGNRLRWSFPLGEPDDNGQIISLPESVEIQRAPISGEHLFSSYASIGYPYQWWDQHPDQAVSASGAEVSFPTGVQAVSFVFVGPPGNSHLSVLGADGEPVLLRQVGSGEMVYFEHADIRALVVNASAGAITKLRSIDLFKDRGLPWERLAEIAVDATFDASYPDIALRYPATGTLSDEQWQDIITLAAEARVWAPPANDDGQPTPWQALTLLIGLRWEFAVLAGFGFCDGPRESACSLDRIGEVLRRQPQESWYAYRVLPRARGAALAPSNLVVCPQHEVAPLATPLPPIFSEADVRFQEESAGAAAFPLAPARSFARLRLKSPYQAEATLKWSNFDPRALGVQIEEEHSNSPVTGVDGGIRRYTCRTRATVDGALSGSQFRRFEVAFPDVRIRARAAAIDGWDRTSPHSAFGPWEPLALEHRPFPPQIDVAAYDSGAVELTLGSWSPDALVQATDGQVEIHRQTASPMQLTVTLGKPTVVIGLPRTYTVAVTSGAASLLAFLGGSCSVGGVTFTVSRVDGNFLYFSVPGAAAQVFAAGPATLRQSAYHPGLWIKVASFSAEELPRAVTFSDPVPVPGGASSLTYCTRVAFWGRFGPFGGIRQALVRRAMVPTPPPFEVALLGLDFFHRTFVRIRLTSPDVESNFKVFVASGAFSDANSAQVEELVQAASPGLLGPRRTMNGTDLYDVLNLPVPINRPRNVTIALQRITDYGASDYRSQVISVSY